MKKAFELLSSRPPQFSEIAAASILKDRYGIEGSLKAQISERDQNFLVEPESGGSFVLKIANSNEDVGVTEFQSKALLHVAAVDRDFPAPRVRSTVDGNPLNQPSRNCARR